ncbi:MAG: ABC transporter substrate-binding protein, partial [Bifidobacterium criceti]|nr:ABC transporter substrate-binding protein [Bifidobacterium criceti]
GAFRTGWQPDYPSAENYLYQLYDSAAADGHGSNDGDYKNAEVDALLAKAASATNDDEQIDLYHQAEEILLEQLPAVPLYYSNANGVAAKGVKGFEMDWQNQPIYANMTK